jgi:hypothetical protein
MLNSTRAAACRNFGLLWLICWYAPLCQASPPDPGAPPHLTAQQLIGAWRLISIEYSSPKGPIVDPFYQAESSGVLTYDSSGWMSVHIVAPHRQAWGVPESRLPSAAASQDVPLKAAAFDTYYAYFGTWNFDAATSVVTHHVKSSLIPAEAGMSYTQKATLERGRLILTVRGGIKGEETVRRKVWERIEDVAR